MAALGSNYYYGRGKEEEGDKRKEKGGKGKIFARPMSHCFLRACHGPDSLAAAALCQIWC